MTYTWKDYDPERDGFVEAWLDDEAARFTGCDEGIKAFDAYWRQAPDFLPGENYWCKLVCVDDLPLAVIAFNLWLGELSVMEFLVSPEKRRKGHGKSILTELLTEFHTICGDDFSSARCVIFPENIASQKAFKEAGFTCTGQSETGDALYFGYTKTAKKR